MIDGDWDWNGKAAPKGNHHLHKLTEFHPYNVIFWDWPAGANINAAGAVHALSKSDPGSDATDDPDVTGRHTSAPAGVLDSDFVNKISGGVPVVYIDGHAEFWPLYTFQNALNLMGGAYGSSPLWCSPTLAYGGTSPSVNGSAYDLTGKFARD